MAKAVQASVFLFAMCLVGFAHAKVDGNDDFFLGMEDAIVLGELFDNDDGHGDGMELIGNTAPAVGGLVVDIAGSMTFTPPADWSGEVTFDYTVQSLKPECLLPMPPGDCVGMASVVLQIGAVADVPLLAAGPVAGDEDTQIPLGMNLALNDNDGSQTTLSVVANVPSGAVLTAGVDQGGGSWLVDPADFNGLGITPPQDFNGSFLIVAVVQVVDVALDGLGVPINSDVDLVTANFFVTVDPVNDDPFQVINPPPALTTDEDVPASVDLAGVWDDVDILTDGQSLSYSVVSIDNAAVATAIFAGPRLDITLIPEASDVGGTVSVRVTDGIGAPLFADIDVIVNPVNDAPVQIGGVPGVDVDEDADPVVVDFSAVFTDVDIATEGDSLSYAASIVSGASVDSANMAGAVLTLAFVPNSHDNVVVRVVATDSRGASGPAYDLPVSVDPVNDAPVVVGMLPNMLMDEDDPVEVVAVAGVFDDVDIVDGDSLSYEVFGNTNPDLFAGVVFVGSDLQITLAADANGVADITVRVQDEAGAPSPGVTFTVDVTGVNDVPDPVDDNYVLGEDTDEIVFDVLANDYLAETPTIILSLGATGEHSYIDGNGDTITQNNGAARIENNEIVYEPASNFWGTDTFTYTIEDANGDADFATVSVTVNNQNDPPSGTALRVFSIFAGNLLAVGPVNGLFLGSYDVDGRILDAMGFPVGSPLSLQITSFPAAAEGTLVVNIVDGSFTFTPAAAYTGTAEFTYRLFDNIDFSPEYTVQIDVIDPPPPADAPVPGEVSVVWNLTNSPLEQSATAPPNVLVTMDDSGSMDWHLSIDGLDEQGRMELSNAGRANGSVRARDYTYLFDLPVNTYAWDNGNGRRLPSEESLPAGNEYGVWRARNSAFNRIYYNPNLTYEPWIGQDSGNNDFADADWENGNVRLDPVSPGNTIDIRVEDDYTSHDVPDWDANGGSRNVAVNDYYIPRYYTSTDAPPHAWNSQHTLVEIRAGNAPFTHAVARDDCRDGNPLECTYEQEMQNFANWFQYYRSRELVSKGSLGSVVAQLQDVRVGYETINNRVNEPIADMNEYYWQGEKKELLDDIYSVDSFDGTPLRSALDRAGKILSCTQAGRACPALAAPEGICQQNFSLLFSDGYWNGNATLAGNHDGDDGTDFDGGKYADTFSSTLADVAMFYYENDLFDLVDDGVPLSTRDIAGVPAGVFSSLEDTLHQHMKTFTIAFGVKGTIDADTAANEDPGSPIGWTDPDSGGTAKIDDMVHAAINGRGAFLSAGNPEELQSAFESAFLEFTQAASSTSAAAFNSTSLRDETLLYRGFYDLRTKTGELSATAVDANGVLADDPTWTAAELLSPLHMDGLAWTERTIVTYDRPTMTGLPFRHAGLNAAQKLTVDADAVAYLRGDASNEQPGGDLRDRPANDGNLGDIVNSSPVFVGRPQDFNRDQRPYPTDDLYSEFVSDNYDRQPIVYVGANDGMLHGFDAATGIEQVAYVPNMLIDSTDRYSNKLNAFVSPFYLHDYYVDMTPRVRDIYGKSNLDASKHWMTAMVVGLGAGGKGFFALDVSDPTIFDTEANAKDAVLWEFSHEDDTYPVDAAGDPLGGAVGAILDPDGQPVKDLGYALSLPSIIMSNVDDGLMDANQEWAAVFGNGPNSTAGIAKLFVLFMDRAMDDSWGAGDFVKLDTGYGVPLPGEPLEGFPNYLGAPTVVDIDNNGTGDLVYAGDRLGNLFRFDIESSDSDDWSVTRLFTATYDDSGTDVPQAVVSRPLVVKNPDKPGYVIIFGTGSFVTEDDGGNTDIQSIYGIWDPLNAVPATAAADTKEERLVQQVITNVVDDVPDPPQTRRVVTSNDVEYEADSGGVPGTYGWYVDLDMERAATTLSGAPNPDISGNGPGNPQFPGEKAIRRFLFRDGAVVTTTVLPATDATSCLGVRAGAILVFSAMTGGDVGAPIIDFNSDGVVDGQDMVTVGGDPKSGGLLFNHTDLDGSLVDLSTLGGLGDTDYLVVSGGNDTIFYRIDDLNDNKTGRLSWTQLESLD